jgi:hypothetical protein
LPIVDRILFLVYFRALKDRSRIQWSLAVSQKYGPKPKQPDMFQVLLPFKVLLEQFQVSNGSLLSLPVDLLLLLQVLRLQCDETTVRQKLAV